MRNKMFCALTAALLSLCAYVGTANASVKVQVELPDDSKVSLEAYLPIMADNVCADLGAGEKFACMSDFQALGDTTTMIFNVFEKFAATRRAAAATSDPLERMGYEKRLAGLELGLRISHEQFMTEVNTLVERYHFDPTKTLRKRWE